MGHALETVADCTILREHSKLTFRRGQYAYEITRQGDKSIYSVSDGTNTITVPIAWAFGLGAAGQTYVYERDGVFYESRVSFYRAINGLDVTMGAVTEPNGLVQAAGREMTRKDVVDCFACHSTGGVRNFAVHFDELKPGVLCENCHTDAARHESAIRSGDVKAARIGHLAGMTTEEASDFCGRCHRTWADIASKGPRGIINLRFQPYRLTNSKCYDATDQRISCMACHNPHEEVVKVAASYDSKCQACHSGPGKTCPVAKNACTNCHMPKLDLPGSHNQFTDHRIRIVRAEEPYPD